MKNKVLHTARYIFLDVLASVLVWLLFFMFRKKYIESEFFGMPVPLEVDKNLIIGFFVLPLFWVGMTWLAGYYRDIYRKSRLLEFGQTFLTTLIGTIILFFSLFLDDVVVSYKTYYITFLVYFALQFIISWIFRFLLTTYTQSLFQSGRISFNTLIIGADQKALDLYEKMTADRAFRANRLVGFVHLGDEDLSQMQTKLPSLGPVTKLKSVVLLEKVEEVIIAVESTEHIFLQKLITALDEKNVKIKIQPDMYDILSGFVRFSNIFGTPLIEVSAVVMPQWQQSVKRTMDIFLSLMTLIILSPLYLFLIVLIKADSKGPAIYRQQRAGRYGKPFTIYKFRSMRVDAESNGPALSSDNDQRMTRVGKMLRKFRLDEFPQFYNVLMGDMSLVGPRPERQFYIEQIEREAPHYKLLQRVKPGITSWGQVKFGYASNVPEMVERLKYDILYIENMSLALDIKILVYTVLTILRAEGK